MRWFYIAVPLRHQPLHWSKPGVPLLTSSADGVFQWPGKWFSDQCRNLYTVGMKTTDQHGAIPIAYQYWQYKSASYQCKIPVSWWTVKSIYWINPCYTSFKTILPTDPQLKCPDSFKQAPTSQLILSNTASTDTFSKACRERERWKRERLDLKWFKNSVLGLEPIPMLRVCLGQRISFSHPWKLLCCVEDLFKQVISTRGGGVHQKERQEDPCCRILHLR